MANRSELLDRYRRTFGHTEYEAAALRVRAVVGPSALPDTAEGGLARDALEALKSGKAPTPKQLAALESMIRMMRPAPLIQEGRPADVDEEEFGKTFPAWNSFQKDVTKFTRCIGRLDRADGKSAGTGFLITDNILVTNRHVLDFLSYGTETLERGQATVSFLKEYGCDDEDPVDIIQVKAVHPTLDAVLLETRATKLKEQRKPLDISAELPKKSTAVVTIGFPFRDEERNPLFTSGIFEGKYGVKHAAPGEVVAITPKRFSIGHDCTTLGGNSGSPVLSMETSEVLGLHMGGSFLWRNEAVHCIALAKFIQANA